MGSGRANERGRFCMPARLKVLLLAVLCLVLFAGTGGAMTNASSGAGEKYIVLYKGQSVPSDAAATIAKAGGTLVYSYAQIGVAIAQSNNASFRANLLKDARIDDASATAKFATQLPNEQAGAEEGNFAGVEMKRHGRRV